jgi:predicted nucleotidyltransferase
MILKEAIEKRQARETESIRRDAMDKAKKIASMLKGKYGAKRVILFGSIVKSSYLHERTDIDLLVEGIKSSDFLRAGADAWTISSPFFDVDIVPVERADQYLLSRALEEGVEL